MKIKGLHFCSFDPFEDNIRFRQHNNSFISFPIISKITIDNTGQASSLGSGTSLSISNFVIGTGSNKMLVCFIYNNGSSTAPSSVTFGAQNLTQLTSYAPGTGNWGASTTVFVYTLANPTTSSSTAVTATWGSSQSSIGMCGASYFGVKQSSSFGTAQKTRSTSSPISVSITTANTNSWIVSFLAGNNTTNPTFTGTSPQAVRAGSLLSSVGIVMQMGDGEYTSTGTYTDQYTWSGGSNVDILLVGVEMIPA